LGIEGQVSWTGSVANPYSLLPHFDVGVLSSRSEGFSNALLEYAAAGVAAVATDVGGTREIVRDGQTGFLVPPGSPALMAERICRLLRDEQLRARLGENARRRAHARFSEETILGHYSDLYVSLARRSRGDNE
jgi:glycosyltransferase involved in cell wall biosynthesis